MTEFNNARWDGLLEIPGFNGFVEGCCDQAITTFKVEDIADKVRMAADLVVDCRLVQVNLADCIVNHRVVQALVVLAPGDIDDWPLHLLEELLDEGKLVVVGVILDIVYAKLSIPSADCEQPFMAFTGLCPPNTTDAFLELGVLGCGLQIVIEVVGVA